MKVSEVLNNVTLKLPGGGKFPLSKYVPYVTNADENIEGLSGGSSEILEFKYSPAAYLIMDCCWFDSEDKAWEYRYRIEINGEKNPNDVLNEIYYKQEPIIVTEQDVKNQINILNKVFGLNWGDSSGNFSPRLNLFCLYKENNISIDEYLILEKSIDQPVGGLHNFYILNPYLLTEEINQQMINDGNSEFLEGVIQNLEDKGLYIYCPVGQLINYINTEEIPNFDKLEEMYNTPEIPQEWIDEHASEIPQPSY